ncbi:hypothetical protein BCR44DRAFT_1002340 [Catenaria anguillulae PL171]|uniref:Uncharacterized protein n=1 Tax=Catenaria anguillulae PL171 TaxID=765915 RepID=A0A1Y2I4P9_9FUNG|nr:hypothetical protein BCR44DRAFT_1002340 [Catenaria anguillulae PL171]
MVLSCSHSQPAPEDRIQFENTPIVAFIPGPNKPKPSCFQQCMEEIADMLQRLEAGFPVTVNGERVRCRVFVIHGGGDYPALNSLTNMRGVNAWFPCVYCYIPGIRQARDGFNTFYPAHTQPYELAPNGNRAASNPPVQERPVLWGKWQDGPEVDCFPPNLHKRTDEWYNFHIGEIALLAGNRQGQEDIGKACGLNGPAAFDTLLLCKNPSTYAVVDPFHLICENVIPNLCKIFCGTLKPMGPAEHLCHSSSQRTTSSSSTCAWHSMASTSHLHLVAARKNLGVNGKDPNGSYLGCYMLSHCIITHGARMKTS